MTGASYTRYELLRAVRNRRAFAFSIGFPLVFFWVIAGPKHSQLIGGTRFTWGLYYMIGLSSFGTMASMISAGGRIAGERQTGWTRQLRITPLSVRAYFRAKVMAAYLTALLTMALLYISGALLGVDLTAGHWLAMTGLILVALVPFAALGIFIGHLLTIDAVGPFMGGVVSLLAFLGGTWFPITGGFLHGLGQLLPSWWIVQAGHVALGGQGWGSRGWITVAAWTAILSLAAAWAYRRDTERV